VLILLPPSEGKTRPVRGRPLELDGLWLSDLTAARQQVLDALLDLCRGDAAGALTALGLTEGQRDAVGYNAALPTAPARRADTVYSGVLYEALDLPTLPPAARAAVTRSAVVFSGLWGVVRFGDRIPAYRCGIGARLPGLGAGLGAYWRRALTPVLDAAAGSGPVLDLRSGPYASTWAGTERTVAVRVLHEQRDTGARSVVSHFNKAVKGRLVRTLAAGGALAARRPADLVTALRDLGHTIVEHPVTKGRPRALDLVVTEL
jgi:cytoplasmic iron level regulating protein YaaA (DUF328/UPF0246 family)